jgi:guanosine-3',5'-bis(diphosphate) 3'-pyrophosphohydrolase
MESSGSQLGSFVKAVAFAAEKHRNQRRKDADASPYINHPTARANEGGVSDATVLCAAVRHDTTEDTETTENQLTTTFGSHVSSVVLEVTDDKSIEKHVRKQRQIEHAPHISTKDKLVKLADKICNLRDILASPPANWSTERKQRTSTGPARSLEGYAEYIPTLKQSSTGWLHAMPNFADRRRNPCCQRIAGYPAIAKMNCSMVMP